MKAAGIAVLVNIQLQCCLNNSTVAVKPCIKAPIARQNSSRHATLDRHALTQSPAEQGKLQTPLKTKNTNFK